jgi:hypothetical protein
MLNMVMEEDLCLYMDVKSSQNYHLRVPLHKGLFCPTSNILLVAYHHFHPLLYLE